MISRIAFFIAACLMFFTSFFFYPRWQHKDTEAAISWDVSGYYWYLPSIFIYHDLKHQGFKDSILKKYEPTNLEFQQGMQIANGNYVMKYSSGMALMYLPFFTAAHLLAGVSGYPQDGFSIPYQFAIQLGGLLVSILGLWYLRKLLLIFYRDMVVGIVIILLVLGCNYLNYAAVDCGMSHCWLFTIYVFLLLNTHYFYQTGKLRYAVTIGLLVGLATLTRPTDIIAGLIPLLWGLEGLTIASIKAQLAVLRKNWQSLLFALLCACLVFSIQLIYWKYVSGHWLYYSYGEQGFSFRHPHPFLYTFSYSTGWLTYSPLFLLSIIGLVPFIKNGKNIVALIAFFFINYYIVCSWDFWRYGGRAMVQSYPVLIFPIASLISWALDKKVRLLLLTPALFIFTYMNVWFLWQCHRGSLYYGDSMTKSYFWHVAGRWWAPASYITLLDSCELYEKVPVNMNLVYHLDFEKDTGSSFISNSINATKSLLLNKDKPISPVYSFKFTEKNAEWLRFTATFKSKKKEWDEWNMTKFYAELNDVFAHGVKKLVKKNMIMVNRQLKDGETKEITMDMKLPVNHFEEVDIFFKNPDSTNAVLIDDLKVWSFNE